MPKVMVARRIQVAPSVQRRKVWLTPTTRCCAVTLPRRETRWNLQGYPKLVNRSQPLVGRSSPYCGNMWRTYCCLTNFFPIVDTCLSCEDIAQQSCAMVPRWRFLATLNSHYGHTMYGSTADIQSAAAEIRRGKRRRKKKKNKPLHENIIVCPIT